MIGDRLQPRLLLKFASSQARDPALSTKVPFSPFEKRSPSQKLSRRLSIRNSSPRARPPPRAGPRLRSAAGREVHPLPSDAAVADGEARSRIADVEDRCLCGTAKLRLAHSEANLARLSSAVESLRAALETAESRTSAKAAELKLGHSRLQSAPHRASSPRCSRSGKPSFVARAAL
jgi:hypothetical protein